MSSIIVYYSLEGNTAYAAEQIAAELGAETLRLETVKPYPDSGPLKFLRGGKSAMAAETPALVPYEFDAAAYDLVIFGFPVWAGNVTPPIRTFIKEHDLSDKRIAAFACQSGSGAEKAFAKLRAALQIDRLEASTALIDPKKKPSPENNRKIKAFCAELTGDGRTP